MGGPNLEVFKFAVYVFFPVVMLVHYGNPDWYAKNVLPVCEDAYMFYVLRLRPSTPVAQYKERIFPPEHRLNTNLPTDSTTLKEELAKIRARNLERKAQREAEAAAAAAAAQQK
ncbi:hypothetical protein ONZ51_g13029 [Trametes cubensis]|uniref:Uncharacterized protein n=1 Tax=Trametes cubensis TaxID=1111947 RepID=A0AAD7TH93_9APHY|nr:hypothetical protein ONZ51_g13029 [Trametes cubensis]